MPRLSRAQEAARQQILQLAGRGLLPADLGKRLLSILQGALPADGQLLYSLDPATGLLNRILASWGREAAAAWFLQHRCLQAEVIDDLTPPTPMRLDGSLILLQRSPSARSPVPQEGYGLQAFFSAQGQGIAALQLVRLQASRLFQPTDGAFLRLLVPTIGRLLCSALAQEHLCAEGSALGPDTAGILLLAPDGHMTFHTPAAQSWITLLRHGEESLASPLPLVVWSAVAQLRTATAGPAQAVVRVPTANGILRVEAARERKDDLVAVALVPERGLLSPVVSATQPLTQQEKRVFGLLVRGLSTREMASALVVSENTVETHLRHVYEKLEVHSRSALLARLFHEMDGLASSCLC
jgi:DNA-binding CsgD family transcriptional regulator